MTVIVKTYKPKGVCCKNIQVVIENNKIKDVIFLGGCNGNAKGITSLIIDMNIEDVVNKLENIKCGGKNTSCPDQLAKMLKDIIKEIKNENN